ncbi:hypothetical protein DPM19_32905 [Actinomadura craniellae]|uniref:DUF732 domain-containing protein n=1 Tax=Actinomadura craniellae TaxID=2231787 RepID=A0A365GVU0_9ACTN|nr:hypothetical protein [Actinomadura craniellae]RAY10937.1 hypothetical protein DPM19_32905 [Actinomadura craniellae]
MPPAPRPNPPLLAAALTLALALLAGCGTTPNRPPAQPAPNAAQSTEEAAFARAAGLPAAEATDALTRGEAFCRGEEPGTPPTLDTLIEQAHDPVYATAVTRLCPKHLPLLHQAKGGFTEGTHRVGKGGSDITPGQYRTTHRNLHGCSWHRWTPSGRTIDKATTTTAPQGVTLTIAPTDGGLTTENCGNWIRTQ